MTTVVDVDADADADADDQHRVGLPGTPAVASGRATVSAVAVQVDTP